MSKLKQLEKLAKGWIVLLALSLLSACIPQVVFDCEETAYMKLKQCMSEICTGGGCSPAPKECFEFCEKRYEEDLERCKGKEGKDE